LLGLMLMVTTAAADGGGTVSPFDFGAGSRELATGSAGIALTDGSTAAYWNPAGLVTADQLSLSGMNVRLFDSDASYQYVGFVWPTLDFGTVGIGLFRLGVDEIDKRDINNFSLGETSDNRLAFYLAYGRNVSGYQVGASLHMEHHSLDEYTSSSSPGLTLAISRLFSFESKRFRSLSLATVGRNVIQPGNKLLETTIKYPRVTEFATSLEIVPNPKWQQSALLSAKIIKTVGIDPLLSLGLEYSFNEILTVRGGLRDKSPSVGGGISYKGFTFDYALVDRDLGSLHLITLSTSFGSSVVDKRKNRDWDREAEFNDLMSNRLIAGKQEMVENLLVQGREADQAGDLTVAVQCYDRALFMAKAVGMDTLAMTQEQQEVNGRLEYVERMIRFQENLDSAQKRFDAGDYLGTQYYANLVLSDVPNAPEAARLLEEASQALDATSSRADKISNGLAMADSLLSTGRLDQANSILTDLTGLEPDNDMVRLLVKRAKFEGLKDRASKAYTNSELAVTSLILDSALILFPGNQYCVDLRQRVEARKVVIPDSSPQVVQVVKKEELSPELEREVDNTYQQAMGLFKSGDMAEAIFNWERVERMAPDFKSVRKYLVNAYKFVGVEEYGRGKLQQAVDIWTKAMNLEPNNNEILNYLERTKTEIDRLQELSYDN
jgi:tetratricopeptide (TPR) repeat protein